MLVAFATQRFHITVTLLSSNCLVEDLLQQLQCQWAGNSNVGKRRTDEMSRFGVLVGVSRAVYLGRYDALCTLRAIIWQRPRQICIVGQPLAVSIQP